MTITIWILKSLTALLFAYTGISKIFLNKNELLHKGLKGLINVDEKQIKAAGVLEVLGAIGLILPSVLNIYPALSAFAALGLALTMIVAGRINYKLNLSIILNIVVFVICILITIVELK